MSDDQMNKQLKMMQQRNMRMGLDQQMQDQKSLGLHSNKYGEVLVGPGGGSKVMIPAAMNNRQSVQAAANRQQFSGMHQGRSNS